MSGLIDVSVVIRVRNERDALVRTLERLQTQSFDGCFEVIVIDNESTDGSKDAAIEQGARVFTLPRDLFTYGRAINLGVARAQGAMVVLLSAHAWPLSTDWMQNMVDNLRSSAKTMGVFCRQVPNYEIGTRETLRFALFDKGTTAITRALIEQRLAAGQSLYRASYFSNSAVILRKWAVQRFPMRDLPYAEENAFALDCILDGFEVLYTAEPYVVYMAPVSARGLYHQFRRQMIAEKLIENSYAHKFSLDYRFSKVNLAAMLDLLLMPVHVQILVVKILFDPKYKSGSRARKYECSALAGICGRVMGVFTWRKFRHTMEVDRLMLELADKSMILESSRR